MSCTSRGSRCSRTAASRSSLEGKWCSSPVWLSPDASAMPVIGVAWKPRSAKSSAAAATIRSRVSRGRRCRGVGRGPAERGAAAVGVVAMRSGYAVAGSRSTRSRAAASRSCGVPSGQRERWPDVAEAAGDEQLAAAAGAPSRRPRCPSDATAGRRLSTSTVAGSPGRDVDRGPADQPHRLVGLGRLEVDLHQLARVPSGGVAHGHRDPAGRRRLRVPASRLPRSPTSRSRRRRRASRPGASARPAWKPR